MASRAHFWKSRRKSGQNTDFAFRGPLAVFTLLLQWGGGGRAESFRLAEPLLTQSHNAGIYTLAKTSFIMHYVV